MDSVYEVLPEQISLRELLVLLLLKAVNITRPRCLGTINWALLPQLVPHGFHEVLSAMPQLLGCIHHVEPLVQYYPRLLLQ